jgi:peptidoglycan/xylan/chitin deacetylase (PgdA/CDA1 family)
MKLLNIFPNVVINNHAVSGSERIDFCINALKGFYRFIAVEQIQGFYYDNLKLNKVCHITVDDGCKCFYKYIFPVLKKHRIPASIYVSPLMVREGGNFWFQEIKGYDMHALTKVASDVLHREFRELTRVPIKAVLKSLNIESIWEIIKRYQKKTKTPTKPPFNMNFQQLQEIHSSGLVAIGAHTLNHPVLANEQYGVAQYQIKKSITDLSDMLNTEIKIFAYPNGVFNLDYGQREVEILKTSGVKMAFSTIWKSFDMQDNPLVIPRWGGFCGGSSNPDFLLRFLVQALAGKRWLQLRSVFLKTERDFRQSIMQKGL